MMMIFQKNLLGMLSASLSVILYLDFLVEVKNKCYVTKN